MKVKTIMTGEVATCAPDEPMSLAAKRLWDSDCGILPVTDPGSGRLLGVITDRDICMAALLSDLPLSRIVVRAAMTTDVRSCGPRDDLRRVHQLMRENQVRRIPVVDADDALLGIVSLNDLAVEAFGSRGSTASRRQKDVGKTLAAVSQHREPLVAESSDGASY